MKKQKWKQQNETISREQNLPADDSFSPKHAIGYSPSQLPVDLESHPHGRVGPCEAQRRVSFPVHDVNVCTSGQEQPEDERERKKNNTSSFTVNVHAVKSMQNLLLAIAVCNAPTDVQTTITGLL